MASISVDAEGTKQFLLGNEAIARGALEGGIGVATAYPGTPSSEILETLAPVSKEKGIYVEWSVNEKVAMEVAAGASYAGIRAIIAMKQNGTNVAIDFLANAVTVAGIGKGLVLVSCDDPSALSSTNEEDTRLVAKWLDIPLLEPSDAQEAKDITKWALDLSEEFNIIFMVRSTMRLSHSRGIVKLGPLPQNGQKAYFDQAYDSHNPAPTKWTLAPAELRQASINLKLNKIREKFESAPFNFYVGPNKADLLIVTGGNGWLYCQEAVKRLKLEDKVGILKLGTLWPLPQEFVRGHLSKSDKILVVEETKPFIEGNVMELVASSLPHSHVTFYGKHSGHIKAYGEMNVDKVVKALEGIMGITYQARDAVYAKKVEEIPENFIPWRAPAFCPGCPYRGVYWAIKSALSLDGRRGFVIGGIGCNWMGEMPTGWLQVRACNVMGSEAGLASGLGSLSQFGFKQPVIAVTGDSEFFHATIPALLNGIYNQANFTLIIADNNTTAMTGAQPHAGTGIKATGEPGGKIDMDGLCRSLGVRVEVCDPFDIKKTTNVLLELIKEEGSVRVMVMRHECELIRARREKKPPYKMRVEPSKCIGEACGCNRLCTRVFGCPGLIWDEENDKAKIDDALCSGCGMCADICPQGAIIKEEV